MDLNRNKSFCILPFVHLSIVGSKVKPCCRFSPDSVIVKKYSEKEKKNQSAEKILKSKEYDELRSKMLNGELIKGCYKCYVEEQSGGASIRQGAYEDFSHLLSRDLKPELKYLEIGFSNICNLKCRSCSSVLSTAWEEDEKKISKKYQHRPIKAHHKDTNNILISDKDLKALEYVKFVGGEPMLNKEFPLFIKQLINVGANKNCVIELFTNASYFPDNSITENLKRFKGVRIHLSIDAYQEKNDYLRYPSNWKKVDSTVGKWLDIRKNNPNISIQMETTISIYNVLYLEKLFDWWVEKNEQIANDECRLHLIFVFYPEYLSILNIPKKLKTEIANKLKNLKKKYKNNEHIIFWINNIELTMFEKGVNKIEEFLRFTKDLDEIRKENFDKTFSTLNNLLKKHII